MTLTREDYDILSRPFEAHEHEFREGGKGAMLCYITEEAITPRLIEVDPAFALTEPIIITDKPENISVKIGITLKGVTRWGIGTSELKTFTGEPTKSAVTDAFKRAARMFGVGLYLQGLKAAKWVNDESSLAKWLAGETQNTPSRNRPSQPSNVRNLPPQNKSNASGSTAEKFSEPTRRVYMKVDRNDNPFMTISGAMLRSREAFRTLGYDDSVIEALGGNGHYDLPDSVTIAYVQEGNFKNVVRIRRDSTGEVVDEKGKPVNQQQASGE